MMSRLLGEGHKCPVQPFLLTRQLAVQPFLLPRPIDYYPSRVLARSLFADFDPLRLPVGVDLHFMSCF